MVNELPTAVKKVSHEVHAQTSEQVIELVRQDIPTKEIVRALKKELRRLRPHPRKKRSNEESENAALIEQIEAMIRRMPALEYIYQNALSNPTQLQMAGSLMVSPGRFNRVFHAVYGITPKLMVDAIRMDRAKKFLLDGTSIQDTARKCGFKHSSHFTLSFKRNVGLPPTVWVEKQKETNSPSDCT
jgi:AraC-like DNA-binding protein